MYQVKDASYGSIKFAGRSKAKVIDNNDPLKRGRIIVDHPLLGETTWIDYLNVPGIFSVPEIGDLVYVECDAGHESYPIAWGNVVKGKLDNPQIPDKFKRVTPTNRGIYSPNGHYIELDDGKGVSLEGNGIRVTTANGYSIEIDDLTGDIKIKGTKVAIGSDSAELLDIVDQIIDVVDKTEQDIQLITVNTALGPSSPPNNAASFAGHSSTLQTIKQLLSTIKGTL
jgi:hypothetical protein